MGGNLTIKEKVVLNEIKSNFDKIAGDDGLVSFPELR